MRKLKRINNIGESEIKAVTKVLKSGILSDYVGDSSKNFEGGKYVRKFEKNIRQYFNVKYAVTVNSWTSGLNCAVGSLDIKPGDEIILSPWTMSACATSILMWNAIPVFADIEYDYFTICPKSIEKKISNKTKAIMAIDIFGQSCDMIAINKIAKKYKLKVISDAAQAIGSKYLNKYSGTLSDIGGFSFNYHKHIHTGEGGVILTNSKILSRRLKLLRNHGESALFKNEKNKSIYLNNMIGNNYRLGEIESAIGIQQLKKLKKILKRRSLVAKKFNNFLKNFKGLTVPKIRPGSTHVYYAYPLIYNENITKVKRDIVYNELKKNEVPVAKNYELLHLKPLFQNMIAYGNKKFPWSLNNKKYNYKLGICPNAEKHQFSNFLGISMCIFEYSNIDIENILKIFQKVWKKLNI
jgi:perosamine synthetase